MTTMEPTTTIRLTQTPADALATLIGRQVMAGSRHASIVDALASVSGLQIRDIGAILGGEVLVTRDLGGEVDRMAGLLGVHPWTLDYRAEMAREVKAATGDKEEGDEGSGTYGFTMSTADPDRAGDIVSQDWQLDEFRRNPVAPWAHQYSIPVVGRWSEVAVLGGTLVGQLEPTPIEGYDLSVTVAEQLRLGILRTVSVGFRPTTMIPRCALPKDDPRWGERGYLMSGNNLHECSVVPIPMNASASRRALPSPAQAEPVWFRALNEKPPERFGWLK